MKDSLLDFIFDQIESFSSYNKNIKLFHYTNLDAMRNIIEERKIRFSHFRFLNDEMEFTYGVKLFDKLCKEKQKELIQRKKSNSLKYLNRLIKTLYPYPDIFVFCLSEKNDSLSQWKGIKKDYISVALKFIKKQSKRFVADNEVIFQKIIYNKNKQSSYFNALIDNYLIYCEANESKIDEAVWKTKTGKMILSTFIKDPKFHEEREWRFVHFSRGTDPLIEEFYSKKSYLLPYKSFDINSLFPDTKGFPITEIMLEPRCGDITVSSIKRFIESKKLKTILIKKSKIPLRND